MSFGRNALPRILAVAMLIVPPGTLVAEEVPEYRLKAEFMERFTRFVDWPANPSADSAPFVLCTSGENPFGNHLQELASTRKINNRSVEVRAVREAAEIRKCDMLFISASARKELPALLSAIGKRPILTVGDTPGYGQSGVMINFYEQGGHLRFEINSEAAERSGLKVKSKLLKLARIVEGE
jgi:hypothetical protein